MLGKILKIARMSVGYSQDKMAKKVSLGSSTISNYELGNTRPDFDMVIKIMKACGYEFLIKNKSNNKTVDLDTFITETRKYK